MTSGDVPLWSSWSIDCAKPGVWPLTLHRVCGDGDGDSAVRACICGCECTVLVFEGGAWCARAVVVGWTGVPPRLEGCRDQAGVVTCGARDCSRAVVVACAMEEG